MEAARITWMSLFVSLQRSSERCRGHPAVQDDDGVKQGLLSTAPLQRAGTADVHVNIPALLLIYRCVISGVNIRQGI